LKNIEGIFLPEYKVSMSIEHNEHKSYYETVESYLGNMSCEPDFVSPEEKQKAIDSNELWTLRWYPDTPISFFIVAASTFNALMEHFKNNKGEQCKA